MSPEQKFVGLSHPSCWLMLADDLHTQAKALYSKVGDSRVAYSDHINDTQMMWDSVNRSTFLLCGFALENAIKAFLVYENPTWISNKTLARPLRSHSLTGLSKKSSNIPYPKMGLGTLEQFESGLESWARYPCGLTLETSPQINLLSEKLWNQYCRLMKAYGKRLEELLLKQWNGPHGMGGHFEYHGEPLLS